ncbi:MULTISPECIES: urease accessory protein UreD [unclassified Streptomyces]|uniref:urease accessory protein UreD n=1 Tax=unclassified Streptomyces TaxID=2593676 RepID=UPI002E14EBE8|nr:urease accessory protein UreD [Streptomyces sp. NBC_01197]WSS48749.1 urease accessory protein UreD [Streptomyces sp. NBC_01180]
MALVTDEMPETSGTGRAKGESRLCAAHHTPGRVPPEVARHAPDAGESAAGPSARVGLLEMGFERVSGRTELVRRYSRMPLRTGRPQYPDPLRPQMAFVRLAPVTGGLVQDDRQRVDVCCGAETEVHLSTGAATEIRPMERGYATRLVNLSAGPDAYLEYLPDPLLPLPGARLYQRTVITADPAATVVIGETVAAGRPGSGARHGYDVLGLDLEVRRPHGRLLALDAIRLCPGRPGAAGPGVLSGHTRLASLFVVTGRSPAAEVADALHAALDGMGLPYGVSVLPYDCGAWLRVLGDDEAAVASARYAGWDAARRLLTGSRAPAYGGRGRGAA